MNKLHADHRTVFELQHGMLGRQVAYFERAEDAQNYVEMVERLAHREQCEQAELDGIAAYLDGHPREACPYPSDSDYAQVWLIGYDGQKKEKEAEARIAELEAKPAIVKTLTNQHGQAFAVYLSDGLKIGIQREGGSAWLRIESTPIVREVNEGGGRE